MIAQIKRINGQNLSISSPQAAYTEDSYNRLRPNGKSNTSMGSNNSNKAILKARSGSGGCGKSLRSS